MMKINHKEKLKILILFSLLTIFLTVSIIQYGSNTTFLILAKIGNTRHTTTEEFISLKRSNYTDTTNDEWENLNGKFIARKTSALYIVDDSIVYILTLADLHFTSNVRTYLIVYEENIIIANKSYEKNEVKWQYVNPGAPKFKPHLLKMIYKLPFD